MTEHDERLIERWLPIQAIGIESLRERTPMTPFPALNRLHVWWARRPLVASRAAVLASLLPSSADHSHFLRVLGIHGDPVNARQRITEAKRKHKHLGPNPYGYKRAFQYSPSPSELQWTLDGQVTDFRHKTLLDPTAGGGAIPFEAMRLGIDVTAVDLNCVAALLLALTLEAPRAYGVDALQEFRKLGKQFEERIAQKLMGLFAPEPEDAKILAYLWARTIACPYCDGIVPLSPNWRLAPDGTGVRLLPSSHDGVRECKFEIVKGLRQQSSGTVRGGDAICPFDDCGRVISGDEVKRQSREGEMGDQLFAVVFKRRTQGETKKGKGRVKWQHGYRAATAADCGTDVAQRLKEKLTFWEARDIVPSENIPEGNKTSEPIRYGMTRWRDLFNARQLYTHCSAVELYHELVDEATQKGGLTPPVKAAFGYLALALDKFTTYNCRSSRWHPGREVMAQLFERHDFGVRWTSAEMPPAISGAGYAWALKETDKCIKELIELSGAGETSLLDHTTPQSGPKVSLSCENAARLEHVADASVDVVVIDPPYGSNLMYAELSDFFYVWLKRTAGLIYPHLFRLRLTDKEHEAVANPAHFSGQPRAAALADLDYRDKMASIFAECRRVLKRDGIMTLMFTHKATGAWDALAQALIEAGFVITSSWPINTEAEGSLHIRDKAAANSTIFLACRPRHSANGSQAYWDDLEREVRTAVRTRIGEFQAAGIRGVDLYLASFGPALEVLSRQWPVQRVTPRPASVNGKRTKRAQAVVEESPIDPYAVTPEDALDAARSEVKRWRLEQLSQLAAREGLDPVTSWFVLAWDAFTSAVFPYDEALRLARVCGVSIDDDVVKRVGGKKGDNLVLWDSSQRAASASLGPADGSRSMLDAVQHAAHLARTRSLEAARALLEEHHLVHNPAFVAAFDAVRQVLPVSQDYSGEVLPGDAAGAGEDFRALEDLRKLLYVNELQPPHQLEFEMRTPEF